MGAMFPPSQWPPEDDVLLKSAVESGASLESLAKGAVQFSRRYTVKELQDRWYSLLYDPVVSTEAAPHMLEVMRSGFSHQPKSNKLEAVKEAALTSGKRKKAENIRKCYYAMRKRICNEPLDIMGIDLLPGSSAANFGDGSGLGIQGPDFDIGPHLFPELGPNSSNDLQFSGQVAAHDLPPFTYEDSTLPLDDGIPGFNQSDLFGPEAHLEGPGFRACDSGPFRNLACSSSTMPQMPMWDDSTSPDIPDQLMARDEFVIPPSCNVNVTDTYLAELSNTLFSDDLHCSDSSPKDGIDASYLEGLSSLLTFDASPSQIELDGTSGGPHLLCEVPHKAAASPIHESKELGPEYQNGVICCTLNTEDPNIPDNDDVFLPVRLPSPTYTPSGFHWKFEDPTSTTDLPNVARKVKVKVGPPAMKNNGGPSHFEGLTGPLDKGSKYSVADKGVKFELPKSNIQQAVLRNVRKGEGYSSHASSANNNENYNVGGVAKESSVDVDQGKKIDCEPIEICLDKRENDLDILESLQKNDNVKVETPNVGLADDEPSCRKTIALPIDESRVLDMEEWSENDVPCFSDVEAMILDMDLSPDLYTNPEVQRYMLEESKKAIVRLEQSADSCAQRTFARQGAFAVLYGRWSKHFIKKPEVILGRSTEESKVDIDLGREKNGGKISRRQAIIKMDIHGTFQLINVGKSWVYVNGKEVLPCQSLSLTSGCLIEVRGLAFIFETSRANINIYLNSIVGGDQPSGHRSLKGI